MHPNIDACGDCLMDSAQSAEQLPAAAVIKSWSSVQTWVLEDMMPGFSMLDAQLLILLLHLHGVHYDSLDRHVQEICACLQLTVHTA
jgi:hypothetical protein